MIAVGRGAYSRELAYRAVSTGEPKPAEWAIALAPSDPEAYLAQAITLLNSGDFEQAYLTYERAIALRPHDYQLWFRLGYAHYFAGDLKGAIQPFRESVRWAPHYAEPRWMLGKVLLEAGQRDEAFVELKRAMGSNPVYAPDVIEYAWEAYAGDTRIIKQVVAPMSSSERLSLALSFVNHEKFEEAMTIIREAKDLSETARGEFVAALLEKKQFAHAYEVWSNGKQGDELINNSSFENGISKDEQEFGWQFTRAAGAKLQFSRDTSNPHEGRHSLRLDFDGLGAASMNLVSTLIVVQPNCKYRLYWSARSKDLITGGLPVVGINDAFNDDQALAQSDTFAPGTSDWQKYSIEFTTGSTTNGVYLNLRRNLCPAGCPVTGHLWLDDFGLQKLESNN